ncbi:MAG: tyrosine-type recombinase/integrase [Pseudonocardia sp.]
MPKMSERHMPNITVYQRGRKWAYTVYGERDMLTGKRERFNKTGFESDDEAWAAALRKQAEIDRGRKVKPSARTVEQFFTEWLASAKYALKPSAYSNYETNVTAYINPNIGARPLQDVSVPMLNTLYIHLLENGRVKPDTNGKMYVYWLAHRNRRNGLGPPPMEVSKACETSYQSAKEAVARYRRGRVPADYNAGLSAKSVKNIHRLIHRAFADAVAWDYLSFNPAEHASLPRQRRRGSTTPKPWSLEELAQWLRVARRDRFAGLWVLAGTTGMRRSELLGVNRDGLDLDRRRLTIDETLISVAGSAEESDGKTEAGCREVSLDDFTVSALRRHLAMLDEEREAFGAAYKDDGWLFVWPDGTRPHPDSVTDRFNRLVDAAGARRIRLHDIRHTWVTIARDAGVDGKIVSDRVGHASETVTQQIYTHRSTGKDQPAADLIGGMIREEVGDGPEEGAPEAC